MSESSENDLNKINELKSKLFSKSYKTKIEYRDHLSNVPVDGVRESWDEPVKKAKVGKLERFFANTSAFKKFFIFSIGFFVIALMYVGYMFFLGGNTVSNDNIDIYVFGNTFTDGGEDLPLQIEITNKNTTTLELVDLVVEYPKGSAGDLSQDTERLRSSLGSIEPGGIVNENVNVILYGQEGAVRPVMISIEYRVEGSNSIFVKEKLFEVSIDSAPIDLALSAPTGVTSGQNLNLNITTTLNSIRSVENAMLRLDYPFGFEFVSSEPEPDLGDNVWSLDHLEPGEELEVNVLGRMTNVFDGEEKTFHASAGLQSRGDKSLIDVVYNSLAHTLSIEKPFINLDLAINGRSDPSFSIPAKDPVTGQIGWVNNLGIPVNDLNISAKFSGNALNRKTIKSNNGFYRSSENMIIWDRNSLGSLGLVDPDGAGAVSFSLTPASLVDSGGEIVEDPTIQIEVSVTGKQLLEGNIIKELHNSVTKTIKVTSEANLTSRALYYTGPFENTGPIPPKVEEETTYTIVWNMTNTSNNLSNVEVKAILPTWMRFLGNSYPVEENLVYNSATRQITWRAGSVSRGAGITSPIKEVAFQVAFLPSLSQVGDLPNLINITNFSALDNFSGVEISGQRPALTTNISGDPGFLDGQGIVVE